MAQMVILLAEDEEIVRTLATTSLQKENFLVLPACNGEDALRVSKSHSKVDLLVADVHMGDGINGIELAKRITEERPGIRVLVMSGYFDSEPLSVEQRLPFLSKPLTPTSLAERVREVLASKIPVQSEGKIVKSMTG